MRGRVREPARTSTGSRPRADDRNNNATGHATDTARPSDPDPGPGPGRRRTSVPAHPGTPDTWPCRARGCTPACGCTPCAGVPPCGCTPVRAQAGGIRLCRSPGVRRCHARPPPGRRPGRSCLRPMTHHHNKPHVRSLYGRRKGPGGPGPRRRQPPGTARAGGGRPPARCRTPHPSAPRPARAAAPARRAGRGTHPGPARSPPLFPRSALTRAFGGRRPARPEPGDIRRSDSTPRAE